MGGQSNVSAKFDRGELVKLRCRCGDKLLHALRHGAGVATAAVIVNPIGDDDFGEGGDLIAVWRDDELLNALSRMNKDVDSVLMPFDVSADWQLVELLLACRVGAEPFRDGILSMICTSVCRRSAEDAHRDRGGREPIPLRIIPGRLLLAGHLETERGSQRRGCSPNSWPNLQIIKLTTKRGLGR